MSIVPRQPTPTIDLREAFRPQAEPVNMYVRPPTPPKSQLWDLAEGLSSFSQSLKGLMDKRGAESDKNAALLGEAQFYKDNSVGYAEAVRSGKVPSFSSPDFVAGYKKAEGSSIGKRLASKWELAYQTWEGRNSQDPAALDQFLAGFLQENLPYDDPDILAGAMPYVQQLQERAYSVNIQDRSDALYKGSVTAHIASSGQDIDIALDAGLAAGNTAYATLSTAILDNRAAALSTGIRADDYDQQLIDLVIAKSVEHGDEAVLGLLDNKVPGKPYTFRETPYGREKTAAAESSIASAKLRAEDEAYTQEQRREAALKDEYEAYVIKQLADDPKAVFSEEFLSAYEKLDPQARINVKSWGEKLDPSADEDEADLLNLYQRVLLGEDAKKVILDGLEYGIIKTPETLTKLQSFGGKSPEVTRYQTNSVYKNALGSLRALASPKVEFYNPDAASPAAIAIQLDYEKAMQTFVERNPDASDMEISEEASRVYGILSKSIQGAGTDAPAYVTPTEALEVGGNSLVQTDVQANEAAAAEEARQNSPEVVLEGWVGEQPPAIETLPQEERQQLEEAASQMGINPAILVERVWRRLGEQGAAAEQPLPAPDPLTPEEEPHADGAAATYAPGQVSEVAPVLDMLGGSEGTDRGRGYNETLAYGALTGGDVELTSMSVNDVIGLQGDMLAHPDNKWNSSAVGRYQIVRKTLRALKRKMGLKGDELFTPELQDQMALQLLKDRGLEQWLAGVMSDGRFATALAKEWASLPTSKGKSFYGGQKASVSRAKVLALLEDLKTTYGRGATA